MFEPNQKASELFAELEQGAAELNRLAEDSRALTAKLPRTKARDEYRAIILELDRISERNRAVLQRHREATELLYKELRPDED